MSNTAQFIYSAALTDFAVRAGVGSFEASKSIAPLRKVPTIKGLYPKRDRADSSNVDTSRAAGEEYKSKKPSKNAMVSFMCKDNGIKIPVPYEEVFGYGEMDLFSEKGNAGYEALAAVEMSHAKAVKSVVWAADQSGFNAIYGAANVNIPSVKWDVSGNNIEKDIINAKDRVYNNCGYKANCVAMTSAVYNAITQDPDSSIYSKLKFTSGASIKKEALAAVLEVDEVIVFDELANSANAGQTQSWDKLYTGNHVLVFRKDDGLGRSVMSLTSTFFFELPAEPFMGVMERNNPNTKSFEFVGNGYFDVQLVAAEAGNVLFNVLT